MRWRLSSFALVLALIGKAAHADPADIARAVRESDWGAAMADARAYPDPVAQKLVTFYRLQSQAGGTPAEIAGFLAQNPDWPNRALLLKRRDEALLEDDSDNEVASLCGGTASVPAPESGPALARCAKAYAALGRSDDAAVTARAAYVAGFPNADEEKAFLARWAGSLSPDDQLARFSKLIESDVRAASALLPRLSPADGRLASARLAFRAGDPGAAGTLAALSKAQRNDPALLLDEMRAARKGGDNRGAAEMWDRDGFAAEQRAGAPMAAAFWSERNQLARRLLADGDNAAAMRLADDTLPADSEAGLDSAFLAGFIALRRLNEPDVASAHFAVLGKSTAAITQARAHYWLGRAAEAAGDAARARREFDTSAAWPTVYYGQLAALASGATEDDLTARIAALRQPGWTSDEALDFAGRELCRAAAMVVTWGDPTRARPFLQQIVALTSSPAGYALAAQFAIGLGLPDQAVSAARRAGRDGTVLAQAGWPETQTPNDGPVPGPVALAIVRQESSFDPGAVSPTGALGLMQLMPATAAVTGKRLGLRISSGDLTGNPDINLRLGSAYLGGLTDRFGGSLPLAFAAYNAGPNRVDQWLTENGDPRGQGRLATIDWIELIPFNETRNYVQRVIENVAVYRARMHQALPYPVGPA